MINYLTVAFAVVLVILGSVSIVLLTGRLFSTEAQPTVVQPTVYGTPITITTMEDLMEDRCKRFGGSYGKKNDSFPAICMVDQQAYYWIDGPVWGSFDFKKFL